MTVVIIGDNDYREFDLVADVVREEGHTVSVWDTKDWPSDIPFTYDLRTDEMAVGTDISVDSVTGVLAWPRHMYDVLMPRFFDEIQSKGLKHVQTKLDGWRGLFNSFLLVFDGAGCRVLCPPTMQHYHDMKPLQLAQFERAGLSVPDTLFTTDPDRAEAFVELHDEVVYKPISAGTKPHRLSSDDLSEAPLERISNAPVQFQEFIAGDDVRVYFLDGEIIGASRYVSDGWTFKRSPDAVNGAERIELPERIENEVRRAAELSPLTFGAADLRVGEQEHALLELNPQPRFAFHDDHGATDVSGKLARYLVDPKEK